MRSEVVSQISAEAKVDGGIGQCRDVLGDIDDCFTLYCHRFAHHFSDDMLRVRRTLGACKYSDGSCRQLANGNIGAKSGLSSFVEKLGNESRIYSHFCLLFTAMGGFNVAVCWLVNERFDALRKSTTGESLQVASTNPALATGLGTIDSSLVAAGDGLAIFVLLACFAGLVLWVLALTYGAYCRTSISAVKSVVGRLGTGCQSLAATSSAMVHVRGSANDRQLGTIGCLSNGGCSE